MEKYFDADEVKRALTVLKKGHIFEIRIIKGRTVLSGYFSDPAAAVECLSKADLAGANCYFTPQRVHEGCSARYQWNRFLDTSSGDVPTTSNDDVTGYDYLLIDLDPVRPKGISSTDAELKVAEGIKDQIIPYLKAQGFHSYFVGMSGNGYHILVDIDLPNTKESTEQVQAWLSRLNELFSEDRCHVDIKVCNPGRLFKLYGTFSQKGRNTEDRPHRMSRLIEVHHEESD